MSFESLIMTYGYIAILVGTFLEGETILILGGFFAHRGYLHLYLVIITAFIGSFSGDQFYFYLGRTKGQELLNKRPLWLKRTERFQVLLNRFHTPILLVIRFLYGIRTIGPFVIGMSRIPASRFLFLNGAGAVIWSIVIASAGYLFGQALEVFLEDVKKYELVIIGIIVITAFTILIIHKYRKT